MVCLDYRACGPTGEPQVVHVDQERGYKIVFVARSFEAFIRGLQDDSAFDSSVELDPSKVKSAWIDPSFAKEHGIDVDKDGWKKKA